ncbi:uncharacterized protein K489DRAFT_372401 [Dissoconium aciculare CBS 342.82]|uniref:Uncharacterized protein n=1 Tax=Dissoconium aciculare CBS 342.82 TaxID=1314786 RepID=A0A6J3LY08_9PEZI|nr:uncharacterized protein K489DRAFT_372401 [Dissoconium aciculare CBS 342.82]KAF1820626.1 hypothetical protein K489DRAFT_372401 [Dissoconium aciculare CBS 342.82]
MGSRDCSGIPTVRFTQMESSAMRMPGAAGIYMYLGSTWAQFIARAALKPADHTTPHFRHPLGSHRSLYFTLLNTLQGLNHNLGILPVPHHRRYTSSSSYTPTTVRTPTAIASLELAQRVSQLRHVVFHAHPTAEAGRRRLEQHRLVTSIVIFLVSLLLTTFRFLLLLFYYSWELNPVDQFHPVHTKHVVQSEAKGTHVGISTLCWLDLTSPTFTTRGSHVTGSSFTRSEYTVVNVSHSHGPPRLVTCVKSSQGFDWNQELFLPSYAADFDARVLEHRSDPVEDIILSDEEAAAMMPQ